MTRQHNYKNYIHLEGRIEEDPSSGDEGSSTFFRLAVSERVWDGGFLAQQIFDVEVYDRQAKYVDRLKKHDQVTVDGTVALRRFTQNGVEQQTVKIKAHRVFKLDFTEWRKSKDDAD